MGCSSSKKQPAVGAPSKPPCAPGGPLDKKDAALPSGSMRYNMLNKNMNALSENYEIHNSLGSAAMGCVVRRVTRKRDGERFACKTFTLSPDATRKEHEYVLGMLRNETELLRSLDHPNVLRVFEVLETPTSMHIITELCTGGDLGKRYYNESEAARVIRKVLRAIAYCHDRHVCHRDLKLENILWDCREPDAEVKLIDFGMSRRFRKGQQMTERVGTIYCMAPEVLYGEYTEKCDMWSIGCVAFHILTGTSPFECATEEETMKRLVAVSYKWPHNPKMPISSEAKHFVYNLLKYDPMKRWSAAQALDSAWLLKHKEQNDKIDSRLRRPSLSGHAVESLRRFKNYGPLKKTALMVVAYHSDPQLVGDLRRLFIKYDVEKNGVLSKEELRLALREFGLSDQEANDIHTSVDVDRSGKIHYLEFLAATIEAYGEVSDRAITDTFKKLDADMSGGISMENFKLILGEQYVPEIVEGMLAEARLNEKGEVDLASFRELMQLRQRQNSSVLELERGQVSSLRSEVLSLVSPSAEGSGAGGVDGGAALLVSVAESAGDGRSSGSDGRSGSRDDLVSLNSQPSPGRGAVEPAFGRRANGNGSGRHGAAVLARVMMNGGGGSGSGSGGGGKTAEGSRASSVATRSSSGGGDGDTDAEAAVTMLSTSPAAAPREAIDTGDVVLT